MTLPIMRPPSWSNMLLITIGTISDFTLIFAMTQGGPGTETAILPVYMYIQAFQFNALGYGSAIALALVLIGALLSSRLHPPATAGAPKGAVSNVRAVSAADSQVSGQARLTPSSSARRANNPA